MFIDKTVQYLYEQIESLKTISETLANEETGIAKSFCEGKAIAYRTVLNYFTKTFVFKVRLTMSNGVDVSTTNSMPSLEENKMEHESCGYPIKSFKVFDPEIKATVNFDPTNDGLREAIRYAKLHGGLCIKSWNGFASIPIDIPVDLCD